MYVQNYSAEKYFMSERSKRVKFFNTRREILYLQAAL